MCSIIIRRSIRISYRCSRNSYFTFIILSSVIYFIIYIISFCRTPFCSIIYTRACIIYINYIRFWILISFSVNNKSTIAIPCNCPPSSFIPCCFISVLGPIFWIISISMLIIPSCPWIWYWRKMYRSWWSIYSCRWWNCCIMANYYFIL